MATSQETPPLRAPSTRIILAWLSAALAITLTVLTATYATRSRLIAGYRVLGKSPSTVLLILRVLSELASLMLASTIYAAFERIQWMLVAKSGLAYDLSLQEYISLQPDLGAFTLLSVLFGYHVQKLMARLWSLLRLLSMALVPMLGILIMSNVSIRMVFDRASTTPTYGFGMGTFNGSLAALWEPMTDLLFSTSFMQFLTDPTRVQDITDPTARISCDVPNSTGQGCNLRYYMAGGIEEWAPFLLASGNGEADIFDAFLAINQTGYLLEYSDGSTEWQFDPTTDCSIYGRGVAALGFCLRNSASNIIESTLYTCPAEVAEAAGCTTNMSWTSAGGFPTSLKTTFRHADVAYSRINGTILSLELSESSGSPANIAASELRLAFDIAFSSNNSRSPFAIALDAIGLGNSTPALPLYAWYYFEGFATLSAANSGAQRRGIEAFQSLMALPIYHCQNKDFAEVRELGYDNGTWIAQAIVAQFPQEDNSTKAAIYPATLRYDISDGRGSLISYVVLSGVTLVMCILALAVGAVESEWVKETSAIPALDFVMKCEVRRKNGSMDLMEITDFHSLAKDKPEKRLVKTANMTVHLFKSKEEKKDSAQNDRTEESRDALHRSRTI